MEDILASIPRILAAFGLAAWVIAAAACGPTIAGTASARVITAPAKT
jgi:hypothetical protein